MSNTIADVLRPAIASRPDATAIVAPSGRLSYAGLDRAADAVAGALWSFGVRPGRPGGRLPAERPRHRHCLPRRANVYPAEVERVIRRHPAVAEVAVFGVPDERLGEKVAALVQLRDGPGPKAGLAQIDELCRAELARYKVPEAWSVVDAFPLNAMGKIIRTGLADLLTD